MEGILLSVTWHLVGSKVVPPPQHNSAVHLSRSRPRSASRRMGYIPQHALHNLSKYKYQGVDKYVSIPMTSLSIWHISHAEVTDSSPSQPRSILSNYVLNPYWNWLVEQWPRSVAPNTVSASRPGGTCAHPYPPPTFNDLTWPQITFSGFVLVLLNFATMLYYDPTYLTEKGGATGPPQWIYFT